MKNKKLALRSLASIPLISTLANSMLIPVLPSISRELKISSLQVSMLITVYAVAAILLIPVAGYLSDRYGRKTIIIPSLIITAIGGAVSGLSAIFLEQSAYWLILLGRLLQGIGAAGAAPIVLPLVGDLFEREQEVSEGLGIIETSNTFGKVLSPIVGAALGMLAWYAPFLAIPLFCAISIVLVAFLVEAPKEPKSQVNLKAFVQSIRTVFREKGRWLYAAFLIGGICMFVVFALLFYLSSTLEDKYGLDGVWKGAVLAIPLATLCMAAYVTGKKIGKDKIRMKWVSFAGSVLLTASVLVIGWWENIVYMIAAMVFSGIGIGLLLPCLDAMITEGIEKEKRGTITSFYSSMRFIGVSLGPPAVSLLAQSGHSVLFATVGGICAVTSLLSLFFIRPRASESPQGSVS
ncbi:MFS transporter [Paenibacillus sp. 32O-W]|uniref:MFS transporter n=1 Tax=Paenibacillus sp. 32O-W TaxID=1695218 RepID=UPI0007215651|nr:MFS transporter [Paenibacillus sp. 32O-W]ALS28674.1 MFS transporter [Paenibacillus sp. 32O-W]